MEWIRIVKIEKFDIFNELKKGIYIDWNKHSYDIKKGDVVYVYVAEPYQKIMFKAICVDGDYDVSEDGEKWMLLKFVSTIDDDRLSLKRLRENGLIKYRIQGAMKSENKPKLFEYINAIFKQNKKRSALHSDKELISILLRANSGNDDEAWMGEKEEIELVTDYSTGRKTQKRSAHKAAAALKRVNYSCEYSSKDKRFLREDGIPYTEAHHLIPLKEYQRFKYSLDIAENIVSLCPYCHRLLHHGRYEDKESILEKLYRDRKDALMECGIGISLKQLKEYYS